MIPIRMNRFRKIQNYRNKIKTANVLAAKPGIHVGVGSIAETAQEHEQITWFEINYGYEMLL